MSLVPRFVFILLLATSAFAQVSIEIVPRAGFAREGVRFATDAADADVIVCSLVARGT
jgi:hypothetical protein